MKRSFAAEVALIGIAAVWGLTFVMVEDAVELIPVMAFLAYRFVPAALVVALVFRKQLGTLGREGLRDGAVMGAFLTAGYIFQTLGLERTSAANAGFITGLFVVLTPLFGAVFAHQRAGTAAWVAAGLSAVGLYLLTGTGGDVRLVGDALVFGCACSFAGHILVTDRAIRRGHDPGALLVVQLGLCGVFSMIVAAGLGELTVPHEATVWSALAVTALIASALGFFVQTYAQKHSSPSRTALILASEPAFAGLFAWLLAGEVLTALGWLGAGLILVAIVGVELVPYLRPAHPLPEG